MYGVCMCAFVYALMCEWQLFVYISGQQVSSVYSQVVSSFEKERSLNQKFVFGSKTLIILYISANLLIIIIVKKLIFFFGKF